MKISAISDVHVKTPHDEADRLLCKFLDHPKVQESDYILLLGDIFDLMCGAHPQYLHLFSHLFSRLDNLLKAGKKVYFFEGNHDVHLEKLFKLYWKNNELIPRQDPLIEEIEGKSYYFSHGDEHEIDNLAYQRYKSFILTTPLRFVANHIMPFALLNAIGNRASKISRKKGSHAFDAEGVRIRFRNGVTHTTQGKYDFILGGHSHVKDVFKIPGANGTYFNNGYALKSNTFIYIENHVQRFETIAAP